MCRALKVLCVAEDPASLAALKRAAVSSEWELAPGAWDEAEAMRQVHRERPHVLVAFGTFEGLVARVLDAYPATRVVADHDLAGASVVVSSLDQVRASVLGRKR